MAKQGKTTTASSSSEPNLAADKPAFVSSAASDSQPNLDLSDHFLIAMPSMSDPVFGGTVVYVCEHHIGGALGVIINKPTEMTMDVLFSRLDLKLEINLNDEILPDTPVMFGGPVQLERGFVLHAPQTPYSSSLKISEELALTTSRDVLDAVAEIVNNGWLTVRADPAILFNTPVEQRFTAAMRLLGISPGMLSGEAGHA
jgi:putative transcriptional regulator